MMIKILLSGIVLLPAFPAPGIAQKKSAAAQPAVVSGVMTENRIEVVRSDWINPGKPLFEYRLAGAKIVDGDLEFTGSYRPAGRQKADVVAARLISTTARSANPWPSAASSTARQRASRDNRQRERGEVSEQTQSLYSAANEGSGCELIYLSLKPPGQANALQVGVVLAHRDNQWGVQINHAICRVIRAMQSNQDPTDAVTNLDRLIHRK